MENGEGDHDDDGGDSGCDDNEIEGRNDEVINSCVKIDKRRK